MQNKGLYIALVVLTLLCLFITYFLGRYTAPKEKEIVERVDTLVIYDTIIVEPDPVIIDRIKTRVKYLKDTIIQTKPFQAILDTIIRKDTIKAMYEFPEHLFSLELRKGKDTIPVRKMYITQTVYKDKKKEWYEVPLYIASGIGIGMLISKVK